MQLLVYITNQSDKMPEVLSGLMEAGVSGATFLNCEGILHVLSSSKSTKLPAFFGQERSLFDYSDNNGKMMLAVMPDELIVPAKQVIRNICGDFDKPNTGIVFTVPVMHFEGVSRNEI